MAKQDFSGLRKPFLETLTELAKQNPKLIFIIGDVGWRFVENYKDAFPNQFLNAGAAEQNMMNVAVGLANEGWQPWVYTMINFIAFRPYEQVRNNIAYGKANVKLVGVKGSEAYAFLGMSHNIYTVNTRYETLERDHMEDQRLLDHLPNMQNYYPKTAEELIAAMHKEAKRQGPSYMRI